MAVSTYGISAGTNTNGDIGVPMDVFGAPLSTINDVSIYLGSQVVSSVDVLNAGFWRFEIDVPVGSTILGVKFTAYAGAPGALGGPIQITGGFLRRQNNGKPWESSLAFASWDVDSDAALAEWHDGTSVQTNPDVWWRNKPAFSNVLLSTVSATFSEWSISEGSISGGTAGAVSGLISQLQSYLDDPGNKATRGFTKTDSISAAIHLFRSYVGPIDQFQYTRSRDSTNAAFHPTLQVEWGSFSAASSGSVINKPQWSVGFDNNKG